MIATIRPGRLSGAVRVPASKSAAHRALIAAALSDAPCIVAIDGLNRDIEATLSCLTALGARFEETEAGRFLVTPIPDNPARPAQVDLDCGESGSTLRFLLPIASALGATARFLGRGRLPERPNGALTAALRAHGAEIDSDHLPMTVSGGLTSGIFALPGNVSSQYITGLLFALPLLEGESGIRLTTKLESAAYVDMTLHTLSRFGIRIDPAAGGWRVPGGQRYRVPGDYIISVEGDWSAAAFWLAANRMGSQVRVEGLSGDTAQGDRAVIDLMGKPEIDASNVPDLVPALAVAAATMSRRTVITGAARLRLKESDRLSAVAGMLNAVGGRCAETDDGLVIDGGLPLRGGDVNGCNDHRIVMAAAVLATACQVPVTVTDAEAVEKSYPDFFKHFNRLGGRADVE